MAQGLLGILIENMVKVSSGLQLAKSGLWDSPGRANFRPE